ncbi:CUB domain-containing protein 1 [Channa argus]|uniref:CUB domain-containing protein 1 n=1 Tax=Channa argus TaxID=215402 RepID=A0A6G1QYJ6_CHAAH|nr:CUB domain-containing protein 1 [Channa argus]
MNDSLFFFELYFHPLPPPRFGETLHGANNPWHVWGFINRATIVPRCDECHMRTCRPTPHVLAVYLLIGATVRFGPHLVKFRQVTEPEGHALLRWAAARRSGRKKLIFTANMRLCATRALLGLLFLFDTSGCLRTAVRPDKGSVVTVSTPLPLAQCAVCTVSGVNDTQTSCHSSLTLVPEVEVKLLFNCSQPLELSYTVTISQTIECTKDTCSPTTVQTQPSILTEFSRTFSYDVKAPEKTVVSLDILGEGLVQTSRPCSDGFQYSVVTSTTNSGVPTEYCHGGSVTSLDLVSQAGVSLKVQPKARVESVLFKASAGPIKGRTMVITADSGVSVVVSRDPAEPECDVCTIDGSTPNCSPTVKRLSNVKKLTLEFGCPKPEDVYSVKVQRKMECTTSSCSPSVGAADPELFKDFKRSLIWDIGVPERTVVTLDFPGDGLREIYGAEKCLDGYQYSVSTTRSDGAIKTNSYCKGGTLSQLNHLLGPTTVAIEVPKGGDLDQTIFNVKAEPRGKSSRMMSVTPDPHTVIIISRVGSEPDCSVCVKTPKQTCNSKRLRISDPGHTSVEFTCPQPQDIFTVEINRQIDCTATACSGDIVQAESSLFPDFNRTFTWDLKVVATRTFQLDFPETGMRQIPKDETCPDKHTYSLVTYLRTGPADIGTFCREGTVTTILARYKGRVSLEVPADSKMNPVDFKLNVGPETSMLATINVNLPRGVSDTDFITANYPGSFPDNQQVQWNFTVPGMHNYTMKFHKHTAPECINNDVEVEYQKEDNKVTKVSLTDPQPQHQQGNFNMLLKNCETNTTLQGLSLKYSVSVMRSGHPVLCTVDLTKQQGVSLQIEKITSDPYCEMSIDSQVREKIIVAAGTKVSLSFLDCPNEDLRLTANKVIACQSVASCPATSLNVPKLDACLPMPLHSFTWHISIPEDDEDVSVGDFCFDGIIQKIQMHTNISITATARDFSKTSGPFLNVSFSQDIPETIIYRVIPRTSSPTLLATPNWPQGMKPSSTVSWIVDLPSQYQASIEFVNVSQPKCQDWHTGITVKMLGYERELLSRREDEGLEKTLLVPNSFYLNMSNCIPEEGHFGVMAKIILEKTSNSLPLILGIAGACLLLLIVLVIVCVILKKKKKGKMKKDSSIYLGKGNIFRPGDSHFTKTRADNNSHIYSSIDDTVVYGNLLNKAGYADNLPDHLKGIQVDAYHTFTGPTDGQLPVINEPELDTERDKLFLDPSDTFIPSRPRTPIDRQDSLGFQDRRMMDNELYTFKSTGDINTIQLIDADKRWQVSEDSL